MLDVYKNIKEYNPSRKWNVLIALDDTIADIISNKKLNPIVTEIRERKLSISTILITQSYFQILKDVIRNCTYFFYYENSKQTRASTNCI